MLVSLIFLDKIYFQLSARVVGVLTEAFNEENALIIASIGVDDNAL